MLECIFELIVDILKLIGYVAIIFTIAGLVSTVFIAAFSIVLALLV